MTKGLFFYTIFLKKKRWKWCIKNGYYLQVKIFKKRNLKSILEDIESDKKELIEDNIRLKQEIRALRTKLDVLREDSESDTSVGNADLLRRLSNLEKVIYGKEE